MEVDIDWIKASVKMSDSILLDCGIRVQKPLAPVWVNWMCNWLENPDWFTLNHPKGKKGNNARFVPNGCFPGQRCVKIAEQDTHLSLEISCENPSENL